MNWHSITDFLAMGGYGIYVWSSFIFSFLSFIIESILLRKRYSTLIGLLRREASAHRFDQSEDTFS